MHEDHRSRVRKRFEMQGLDGFEEHQVLEMLLFYAIPRKDTNVVAHRLIERFGGFTQVMDASVSELEKVEGMGHQSALFLKFVRSCGRYYNLRAVRDDTKMDSLENCVQYLLPRFEGKRNEEVHMLCLDSKRCVIACVMVGEGDICSVNVSVRKIVNLALSQNAVSVVLAHNHPGGLAFPSKEDAAVTKNLAAVLRRMEICLLDHIVIADGDYVSMVTSGFYRPNDTDLY